MGELLVAQNTSDAVSAGQDANISNRRALVRGTMVSSGKEYNADFCGERQEGRDDSYHVEHNSTGNAPFVFSGPDPSILILSHRSHHLSHFKTPIISTSEMPTLTIMKEGKTVTYLSGRFASA